MASELQLLYVDGIAEALDFPGTQRQKRRRVYALHEKDPNFPTIVVGGRIVARPPALLKYLENLERAKLQGGNGVRDPSLGKTGEL